MGGGCQGCTASSITLKQGVESYIVAKVDGVNEIVDMTDHSEGENPYYTQPILKLVKLERLRMQLRKYSNHWWKL